MRLAASFIMRCWSPYWAVNCHARPEKSFLYMEPKESLKGLPCDSLEWIWELAGHSGAVDMSHSHKNSRLKRAIIGNDRVLISKESLKREHCYTDTGNNLILAFSWLWVGDSSWTITNKYHNAVTLFKVSDMPASGLELKPSDIHVSLCRLGSFALCHSVSSWIGLREGVWISLQPLENKDTILLTWGLEYLPRKGRTVYYSWRQK